MIEIKGFRKKTIIKAVIIPLAVTAVVLLSLKIASPAIESRIPDAREYTTASQDIQEV